MLESFDERCDRIIPELKDEFPIKVFRFNINSPPPEMIHDDPVYLARIALERKKVFPGFYKGNFYADEYVEEDDKVWRVLYFLHEDKNWCYVYIPIDCYCKGIKKLTSLLIPEERFKKAIHNYINDHLKEFLYGGEGKFILWTIHLHTLAGSFGVKWIKNGNQILLTVFLASFVDKFTLTDCDDIFNYSLNLDEFLAKFQPI